MERSKRTSKGKSRWWLCCWPTSTSSRHDVPFIERIFNHNYFIIILVCYENNEADGRVGGSVRRKSIKYFVATIYVVEEANLNLRKSNFPRRTTSGGGIDGQNDAEENGNSKG